MVETWVAKMRLVAANRCSLPFKNRCGIAHWIIGAVVVFIGVQTLRIHMNHASDRMVSVAAFGGVNTFYGLPQMNHDGSQITYVATTEARNCTLFLLDAVTKKQREIVSQKFGSGHFRDEYDLRAWAWSPDDSAFIYSMLDKLVICSSRPDTIPAELPIHTASVSELVWLSPTQFAFVEQGTNLCYAQKESNDQWHLKHRSFDNSINNLTAIGTNSVAWLQANLIFRINLDSDFGTTNRTSDSTAKNKDSLPKDGLILWLDASTVHQPDQTSVSQLIDLSSNGNTAVEDGCPPTFTAPESPLALNGKGTIRFSSNGSPTKGNGLKTVRPLGISGSSARSIFAVMRRAGGRKMMISTGDASEAGTLFGLNDQDDWLYLPTGMHLDNRIKPSPPAWNIFSVLHDGANQKGFVNGVLKGTTSFTLKTTDSQVQLGMRRVKNNSITDGSDGDFAELLIYDHAFDPIEQRNVEDYLSMKWFNGKCLPSHNKLVWVDPTTNKITDFSYSEAKKRLLIGTDNGETAALWTYSDQKGLSKLASAFSPQNVLWLGSNSFSYLGNQSGHRNLVLSDDFGTENSRLFEHGNVSWFAKSSDGRKLLILGALTNEPAFGIWSYNLETSQLCSVVPYSDHPAKSAKQIVPFRSRIKFSADRTVNCIIYPPATVERHKKYPLVIGDTWVKDVNPGPLFQSSMAACGAFVAIVERPNWYGEIEHWKENVMDFYQHLKLDPAIDKENVFLFATSAETHHANKLIQENPGLWKGVILFNPIALPDFSNSPPLQRRPKLLISSGAEENLLERFNKYQENSMRSGVLVEMVIHAGEAHRFVGKTAKLERVSRVEQFIFEQ